MCLKERYDTSVTVKGYVYLTNTGYILPCPEKLSSPRPVFSLHVCVCTNQLKVLYNVCGYGMYQRINLDFV